MKKFLFSMVTLLMTAVASQAMSYEQARQQALFLADKMAYELNLTEDQYEACYEVNLDYLMGVTGEVDLYGDYWTRRNLDLSYILLDWQYRAFCNAAYFYRPLYWSDGFWHFGIYARYPHRDYFYFGRPVFWNTYRGGHSWHHNGGHSWYHGRTYGGRNEHHPNGFGKDTHRGMRNSFDDGHYGRGGNIDHKGPGRGQSSTRTTSRGNDRDNHGIGGGSAHKSQNETHRFGGSRNNGAVTRQPADTKVTRTVEKSTVTRESRPRVERSTSFDRSSSVSRSTSVGHSSGASRSSVSHSSGASRSAGSSHSSSSSHSGGHGGRR